MKTLEDFAVGLVIALCAAALVGGFFVAMWPLYARWQARRTTPQSPTSTPPSGANSPKDEEV